MAKARGKAIAAQNIEPIGHWVFLLGVFIAIAAGLLAGANTTIVWVLVILGLLVGILNLKMTETQGFLIAALVLMVSAGSLNVLPVIGTYIGTILQYIVIFVAPAALVVALMSVYKFAAKL